MCEIYNECTACPRNCKASRYDGTGFCKSKSKPKIARASRHMWEEPCISGENGSGTIFFSGCNLRCVYCQNHEISQGEIGVEIDDEKLEELFLIINKSSVHNINLVTPTHYLPSIIRVLKRIKGKLTKPIVYNCSGYENIKLLKESYGLIDIFLTDIKYKSHALSEKYSSCPDYYEVAKKALEVMLDVSGKPKFSGEILTSGTIVRHLVLPSNKDDSIELLKDLKKSFGNESFILSLMSQFTPTDKCSSYPEINRPLTTLEYRRVCDVSRELGFLGYMQEKSSAIKDFIPDFRDYGEFLSLII